MNVRGMTLVTVLIVGAIAALLSTSIMRMLSKNLKFAQGITQKGEYTDILNTIRLATSSPKFCKCNFLNGSVAASFAESTAASYSIPITALKIHDDQCNPKNTLLQVTSSAPAGKLWIKNLEIKNFNKVDSQNYTAKLSVDVEKPQGSIGGTSLHKEFDALFTATTANSTVTLNDCEIEGGSREVTSSSTTTSSSSQIVPGTFFGANSTVSSYGPYTVSVSSSFCTGSTSTGTITCTVPSDKVLAITNIIHNTVVSNGCYINSYFAKPVSPFYFAPGSQIVLSPQGAVGSSCDFSGQVFELSKFKEKTGTFFGVRTSVSSPNITTANQSFCTGNVSSGTVTCTVPTGKIVSILSTSGTCFVNNVKISSDTGASIFQVIYPLYFSSGTTLQFKTASSTGQNCYATGLVMDE